MKEKNEPVTHIQNLLWFIISPSLITLVPCMLMISKRTSMKGHFEEGICPDSISWRCLAYDFTMWLTDSSSFLA